MSAVIMETTSGGSNQTNQIVLSSGTIGGGGGGGAGDLSYELEQQHQNQQDLLATVIEAAQINNPVVEMQSISTSEKDSVPVEVQQQQPAAPQMEEGIIFRNIVPNSGNKLQMIGGVQQNRIIFLNSATSGSQVLSSGNVKTTSYINMAKAGGAKVMNLIGQPLKSSNQQQKVPKNVQVLKRIPQQSTQQQPIIMGNLVQRHLVQQPKPGQQLTGVQQPKGVLLTAPSKISATKMGIIQQGQATQQITGAPLTMKMFNNAGQKVSTIATSGGNAGIVRTVPQTSQFKGQLPVAAAINQTKGKTVPGINKFNTVNAQKQGNSFKTVSITNNNANSPVNRSTTPGFSNSSEAASPGILEVAQQEAILHHQKVVNPIKGPKFNQTPVQQMIVTNSPSSFGIQPQNQKFVSTGAGAFLNQQPPPQSPTSSVQFQQQSPAPSGQQFNIIQSGTIKYVNSHNVVQGPRFNKQSSVLYSNSNNGGSSVSVNPSGGANVVQSDQSQQGQVEQSPQHNLEVTNVIQYGSSGGGQQAGSGGTGAVVSGGGQTPSKSKRLSTSSTQLPDDMFLPMNDEASARILQSLSQKSTHRYMAQQQQQQSPAKYHYVMQNFDPNNSNYTIPAHVQGIITTKHGPEYFRVNTSDIQTTTTTFIDNIPLTSSSRLVDEGALQRDANNNGNNCSEVDQEDIIGEEIRPPPIMSNDLLHAVLQDHTYVVPMPSSGNLQNQQQQQQSQQQLMSPSHAHFQANSKVESGFQIKCTTNDLLNAAIGLGEYSRPIDDDNASVISNDSRSGKINLMDNDLGEETETAAEGEGEDDSITRCICDLTHDDGYMICCDKCSTWQHVDCMGIDRANIPDEYNCDLCQPRPVDKNRARTLQLLKRREQQSLLLMNQMNNNLVTPTQQLVMENGQLLGDRIVPGGPVDAFNPSNQLNKGGTPLKNNKKGPLASRRKSELSSSFAMKKQKREQLLANRANGKRKEKKTVNKRKNSTSKQSLTNSGDDKQMLRTWIDNYEMAVTNHYSPELRARLLAIGKQQQQASMQMGSIHNKSNLSSLLNQNTDLEGQCTTIPHGGGMILISRCDMNPNFPIVELRGKYMLSGQYRHNSSTGNNGRNQFNKNPGPFIFFYRIPNEPTEICVDTRTYGNEARFVRRSCRPNAELVHHIEKGVIHLYIVSIQPIKSSTEITIRHEPHDLTALSKGGGALGASEIQSTSTVCACGAIKDCPFSLPSAGNSFPVTGNSNPNKLPKRLNGHLTKSKPLKRDSEGNLLPGSGTYRRKMSSRNRSTSSSGESNTSLLSPNIINDNLLSPPLIKQPQLDEIALNGSLIPQSPMRKDDLQSPTPVVQTPTTPIATTVVQAVPINLSESRPSLDSIPQIENSSSVDNSVDQIDSPEKVIPNGVIQTTGQPPLTPINNEVTSKGNSSVPPSPDINPPSSNVKKNKELRSLSSGEDKYPSPTTNKENAKETAESKKMTREERKMEAIMKAFEKMERSSQRKQELKQQKGSGEVTSRRRDSISQKKDSDFEDKRMGFAYKRKKRKGSKSYQQVNQRKIIRRRSRVSSNETDLTSEESTGSVLSSPPINIPFNYASNPLIPTRNFLMESKYNGDVANANMLLSLANAGSSPKSSVIKSGSGSPSGPLSSAYMMVKEAIGPFENQIIDDFKLPVKATKTKKSIMNDWLNQDACSKSAEASPKQNDKPFETLVQAVSIHENEPQNLCKKVEEFLYQNDVKCDSTVPTPEESPGAEENKWIDSNRLSVPLPMPTPPSGGSESAVKKRWLRQAISEECSDEIPASPPPNGYSTATPLKKRRFARQCSDAPEDLSPTVNKNYLLGGLVIEETKMECDKTEESGKDTPLEEDVFEPKLKKALLESKANVDVKQEPDQNQEPMEEEIDVISSPLSCEKIVRDDNLVKIEPENEEEKDIKIEVVEDVVPTKEMECDGLKEEEKPKLETKSEEVVMKQEQKITPERFDIEALHPEADKVENNEVQDEIADIQKRLHSFHAENILFLKSLNKKSKPTPASGEISNEKQCDSSTVSNKSSSANSSTTSSAVSSPLASPKSNHGKGSIRKAKRKKLNFDDENKDSLAEKKENSDSASMDKPKRRTKTRFSSPISQPLVITDLNSNTVEDKPVPVQPPPMAVNSLPIPPPMPINTSINPPLHLLQQPPHPEKSFFSPSFTQLGINTSIPPPQLPYSSMFNKFPPIPGATGDLPEPPLSNGFLPPATSSRLLLSELLENAQKTNHFNNEISNTPSLSTLFDTNVRPPVNPGYFTLNSAPVPMTASKVTLINAPPVELPATANITVTTPPNPRVFVRTASADPRLNPNLNTPEPPPAPKRKLSINEYRKRMQLSTPTSETPSTCISNSSASGNEEVEAILSKKDAGEDSDSRHDDIMCTTPIPEDDPKDTNLTFDEVKEDESYSSGSPKTPMTDDSVLFSPAPTQLELQQESISERIKSYKSFDELLTKTDGSPLVNSILQNNQIGASILESLKVTASPSDQVAGDGSMIVCNSGEEEEEKKKKEEEEVENGNSFPEETNNNSIETVTTTTTIPVIEAVESNEKLDSRSTPVSESVIMD